ncbi:cytochrome P450 [uncultured Enterovirga sp.]|uniref:cytochrome P450 n=1 Tax=uncultured Enterovirga sp. TaxID=2026352 RepID=UPI0035CB2762
MPEFLDRFDRAAPADRTGSIYRAIGTDPEALFAELLRHRPILVASGVAVVTKHADCLDVLRRHHEFSVRAYAAKMKRLTGPFFLGEDDTALYQRDASALRLALRREDLPAVQAFVRERASAALPGRTDTERGSIEIVSELTRRVPAEVMGFYLGVPGPTLRVLQDWARELFRDIFTNLGDDPEIIEKANCHAAAMVSYVDELVANRRREGPGSATVLDRLLTLRSGEEACLDDLTIRHNLIGLVTGAVDTTSKAVVNIVAELLGRPSALASARAALQREDAESFESHCFEALRLRPQAPMLVRTCERDSRVAGGTGRESTIAAGSTVFVGTWAAMRDPDVMHAPDEFSVDRPADLSLHFGSGLHACFGRHLIRLMIPELVRAVVSLPDVRAVPGESRTDGPFPDAFEVAFGPAAAPSAEPSPSE